MMARNYLLESKLQENIKNTNFRSWKSGKRWLYASSLILGLVTGAAVAEQGMLASADNITEAVTTTPQAQGTFSVPSAAATSNSQPQNMSFTVNEVLPGEYRVAYSYTDPQIGRVISDVKQISADQFKSGAVDLPSAVASSVTASVLQASAAVSDAVSAGQSVASQASRFAGDSLNQLLSAAQSEAIETTPEGLSAQQSQSNISVANPTPVSQAADNLNTAVHQLIGVTTNASTLAATPLHNLNPALDSSITGVLSTLTEVGKVFTPDLTKAVQEVIQTATQVMTTAEKLVSGSRLSNITNAVLDIFPAVESAVSHLSAVVTGNNVGSQTLGSMSFLADAINSISAIFGKNSSVAADLFNAATGILVPTVNTPATSTSSSLPNLGINGSVDGLGSLVLNAVSFFNRVIGNVVPNFNAFTATAAGILNNFLRLVVPTFDGSTGGIVLAFNEVITGIVTTAAKLFNTGLGYLVPQFIASIGGITTNAVKVFNTVLGTIVPAFNATIAGIVSGSTDSWAGIGSAFSQMIDMMVAASVTVFDGVLGAIVSSFNISIANIVADFNQAIANIVSAWKLAF